MLSHGYSKQNKFLIFFFFQVHIFCIVREQAGGVTGKERLKQALQKFKILPLTSDRQQMTEEERYLDYGFEHRVTVMKGLCLLLHIVRLLFNTL